MTPERLARQLVDRLRPRGVILEPCAGDGAFLRALAGCGQVEWCEIDRGRDFLKWTTHVDWIITNPPWSAFRPVLENSLRVADNVALLATVNHWWTRRRCELIQQAGFGFDRLILFRQPREFQPTGFQLGMMQVTRGYTGPLSIEHLVECRLEGHEQAHDDAAATVLRFDLKAEEVG